VTFQSHAFSISKQATFHSICRDVTTWKQIQTLPCHQLTITQLAFSPDDTHLVSVSRDRRWGLYKRQSSGRLSLVACSDKTNGVHKRIIWGVAWSHDSRYFLTISRDGVCVVWGLGGDSVNEKSSLGENLCVEIELYRI
jgi:WD domain, G-beta repeat.